jgi:hypothetical protein
VEHCPFIKRIEKPEMISDSAIRISRGYQPGGIGRMTDRFDRHFLRTILT